MSQLHEASGSRITLKLPPEPEPPKPKYTPTAPAAVHLLAPQLACSSPLSPSRSYDSLARQADIGPINLPEQERGRHAEGAARERLMALAETPRALSLVGAADDRDDEGATAQQAAGSPAAPAQSQSQPSHSASELDLDPDAALSALQAAERSDDAALVALPVDHLVAGSKAVRRTAHMHLVAAREHSQLDLRNALLHPGLHSPTATSASHDSAGRSLRGSAGGNSRPSSGVQTDPLDVPLPAPTTLSAPLGTPPPLPTASSSSSGSGLVAPASAPLALPTTQSVPATLPAAAANGASPSASSTLGAAKPGKVADEKPASPMDLTPFVLNLSRGQWSKGRLLYEPGESGKKLISAGTLEDLLGYVLDSEDLEFWQQFAYVHSYYVPSTQLFAALEGRFRALASATELPPAVRLAQQDRVLKVLTRWFEAMYHQFHLDPLLQRAFTDFAEKTLPQLWLGASEISKKAEAMKQLKELMWEMETSRRICASFKIRDTAQLVAITAFLIRTSDQPPLLKDVRRHFRTYRGFIACEVVDWAAQRFLLAKSDVCKLMDRLIAAKVIKAISGTSKSGEKDPQLQTHFSYSDQFYSFKEKRVRESWQQLTTPETIQENEKKVGKLETDDERSSKEKDKKDKEKEKKDRERQEKERKAAEKEAAKKGAPFPGVRQHDLTDTLPKSGSSSRLGQASAPAVSSTASSSSGPTSGTSAGGSLRSSVSLPATALSSMRSSMQLAAPSPRSAQAAREAAMQASLTTPGGSVTPLLSFNTIDVARQLTLVEFQHFKRISMNELLNQVWNKKDKAPTHARHLIAMIERFNEISYWVATELVTCPVLKMRVELMKRLINIAELCRQMNNYSTMMQIVVGLNLACVQRLEKTWEALGGKFTEVFKALMAATSASKNYLMYREALRTTVPPAIPYVGVYLRDLTFIEDGNPSYLAAEAHLINVVKVRMLAKVFSEIRTFQQVEPVIEPSDTILRYITTERPLIMKDDVLKKESLVCEPPSRHSIQVPSRDMEAKLAAQQHAASATGSSSSVSSVSAAGGAAASLSGGSPLTGAHTASGSSVGTVVIKSPRWGGDSDKLVRSTKQSVPVSLSAPASGHSTSSSASSSASPAPTHTQ